MKYSVKIKIGIALFLILLLSMPLSIPITIHAETTGKTMLETSVSEAGSDCIMLGINGNFYVDSQAAINRINEIRKEACEDGNIADPRDTSRNLSAEDYVPIQWSASLEKIARIRAVEGGLARELLGSGHSRLNGQTIWFKMDGVQSYGEILAYNYTTGNYISGINQWYSEKSLYQETRQYSSSTGHYVQLINPSNLYIGLGDFYSESIYYPNTLAGQLSSVSSIQDTSAIGQNDVGVYQKIEVLKSYIGSYSIKGNSNMSVGEKQTFEPMANVIGTKKTVGKGIDMPILENLEFASSNSSVFEVDSTGTATATGVGSADLTVSLKGEKLCYMTITVTGQAGSGAAPSENPDASSMPGENPEATPTPTVPSVPITPIVLEEEYHIAAKGKIDVGSLIREHLDDTGLKITKYKSSDKKIATVSSKGIVTGKADGTVSITAYAKIAGINTEVGTVTIIVNKPVFKITDDITYLGCEMDLNEYIQNLPEDVPIMWSIPKSRLDTTELDPEKGTITPYKSGNIRITCIIGEGRYAAKYTSVLKVKIPKMKENVTVKQGQSKTIAVTNLSSYTDIEWSGLDSKSSKVISVTDTSKRNIKKITAISSGTAKLTAIIDGVPYTVIITVP